MYSYIILENLIYYKIIEMLLCSKEKRVKL